MSSTPTANRPAENPDPPDPRSAASPTPVARLRLPLPGFLHGRPIEDPTTEPAWSDREPGTSPGPGRNAAGPGSPDTPTPGLSAPRTTSSDGEPSRAVTRKELRAAVAGVLMVIAGFAAWSVSKRGTHTLRVPDDDERGAIAAPLAAILERHVGTAFMTADLVDGVSAASAFAAYVGTNPLTRTGHDPAADELADPFDTRAASAAHGYQEP